MNDNSVIQAPHVIRLSILHWPSRNQIAGTVIPHLGDIVIDDIAEGTNQFWYVSHVDPKTCCFTLTPWRGVQYRPHRGGLDEAMAEVRLFHSKADLIKYLESDLLDWAIPNPKEAELRPKIMDADVELRPLGFDERINWNTFEVCLRCPAFFNTMPPNYFGCIGYTDGDWSAPEIKGGD